MGIKVILEDKLGRHPEIYRSLVVPIRFPVSDKNVCPKVFSSASHSSLFLSSLSPMLGAHPTPSTLFLSACGSESLLPHPWWLFTESMVVFLQGHGMWNSVSVLPPRKTQVESTLTRYRQNGIWKTIILIFLFPLITFQGLFRLLRKVGFTFLDLGTVSQTVEYYF